MIDNSYKGWSIGDVSKQWIFFACLLPRREENISTSSQQQK